MAASTAGALSAAEDRLHEILAEAGVDGWVANASIRWKGRTIAVVDVLFAAAKLVIEVDGWATHSSRAAFQRDRSRQNALAAAGYVVLRFTWADLTERPHHVVHRIREVLAEWERNDGSRRTQ